MCKLEGKKKCTSRLYGKLSNTKMKSNFNDLVLLNMEQGAKQKTKT